jgi:hypothetical protein
MPQIDAVQYGQVIVSRRNAGVLVEATRSSAASISEAHAFSLVKSRLILANG